MNKFETELERKCCEAGLRESPAGLSCGERTRHVRYGPDCVAAFLSCCRLSEALTREAREEQLLLGTSKGAMVGGTRAWDSTEVPWCAMGGSTGDVSHGGMGWGDPAEESAGP